MLRGIRLAEKLMICSVISLTLAACGADPLDAPTEARLQRIYNDLPERQKFGVIQNLRYSGKYKGPLQTVWSERIATAMNELHYELDVFDEDYDLASDAGTSKFMTDLSGQMLRERITDEVSGLPHFKQVTPPGTVATFTGDRCLIDGGQYERNGETAYLTFSVSRESGGLTIDWDGWPGGTPTNFLGSARMGDGGISGGLGLNEMDLFAHISLLNFDNRFIVRALKTGTNVSISDEDIGSMDLPTGDLYRTGIALERCAQEHGFD